MRKVLALEDEDNIRSFVVLNLNRAGYDTVEATTGEEALELLKRHPETRIALLDVNLPGIDGFEVCRRIRATNAKMGIIMLTARTQEMDKVTGLMTGADDYVTKPFSLAELTARLGEYDAKAAAYHNGCRHGQSHSLLNGKLTPGLLRDLWGLLGHDFCTFHGGSSRLFRIPGQYNLSI